jgi:predicted GNAT family acetyltransferase
MRTKAYPDAAAFLQDTRAALEVNEAANNLMLGVCARLARQAQAAHPARDREQDKPDPYLKTVQDEHGLVLAAMMTPPHKLVAYGHRGDLERAARVLFEDLVGEGWHVPGVLGPSAVATAVARGWEAVTGQAYDLEMRQRVYEVREVISPTPARGRLRLATEPDVELVAEWRYAFHEAIFGEADRADAERSARSQVEQEAIFLWDDGGPVSTALKTRPTKNGISVSGVYTPPALRGKGYATACVGELSRMLLEEGWAFCSLFADLANPAANRVYEKVGYKAVCDYDEYTFHPQRKSL